MGYQINSDETPHDMRVERFARREVNLGFSGGQEKTVVYDTRTDTSDGGVHFRQYVEVEHDEPNVERSLEGLARERNVFTVESKEDISYREFCGVEEKYLVSWDNGQSVRILDSDELDIAMDVAAASQRTREEKRGVEVPLSDEPGEENTDDAEETDESNEEDLYDRDIPERVTPGK